VSVTSYWPFAKYAVTEITARVDDRVYVLNYHHQVDDAEVKKRVLELYADDLRLELSRLRSPTSPMSRSPPSPGIFVMDIDNNNKQK
jgi:hypothetical protein